MLRDESADVLRLVLSKDSVGVIVYDDYSLVTLLKHNELHALVPALPVYCIVNRQPVEIRLWTLTALLLGQVADKYGVNLSLEILPAFRLPYLRFFKHPLSVVLPVIPCLGICKLVLKRWIPSIKHSRQLVEADGRHLVCLDRKTEKGLEDFKLVMWQNVLDKSEEIRNWLHIVKCSQLRLCVETDSVLVVDCLILYRLLSVPLQPSPYVFVRYCHCQI